MFSEVAKRDHELIFYRKYFIGSLKGKTNMPEYGESSAFYEEVKKVRRFPFSS